MHDKFEFLIRVLNVFRETVYAVVISEEEFSNNKEAILNLKYEDWFKLPSGEYAIYDVGETVGLKRFIFLEEINVLYWVELQVRWDQIEYGSFVSRIPNNGAQAFTGMLDEEVGYVAAVSPLIQVLEDIFKAVDMLPMKNYLSLEPSSVA